MSEDIANLRNKGKGTDVKNAVQNHDDKVLAYFESPKNAKLFSYFFLSANVQCYSRGGKGDVVKAVEESRNLAVAIGIIDADFERLINPAIINCPTPDIFWTDCHDTEMMMLKSTATIDKVLHFYDQKIDEKVDQTETKRQNFEKQNKMSVLDFIMKELFPMSVLRYCSGLNSWDIKFRVFGDKGVTYLNYSEFFDSKTLKFSKDNFLKTVKSKFDNVQNPFFKGQSIKKQTPESKQAAKEREAMQKKYETELKNAFDLWELTNGHDVLHVLSLALEGLIANYKSSERITPDRLELDLMLAYSPQEFGKTNLFQQLQSWENEKGRKILLPIKEN